MKYLILLVVFLIVDRAYPWVRTYENAAEDLSAQQTTDGGYILSGGATLIKTDSQGYAASIFDATGRKVDEVHAPLQFGSITWGEGYGPGVYFIREESDHHPTVYRVVLIK